jgi:hypothetical protein
VADLLSAADLNIAKLKIESRFLVYGDPSKDAVGLKEDDYFKAIFSSDACSVVTSAAAEQMVVLESCETFDRGRLTYGLNAALLKFQEGSLNLLSKLNATTLNITQSDAAGKITEMETLMNQISSVIISARPRIPQVIRDTTLLNSTVIEPIQLVLAFLGAVWIYLRVYLPFMKALERDTKSMHSILLLLGASSERNTDAGSEMSADGHPLNTLENGARGQLEPIRGSMDSDDNIAEPRFVIQGSVTSMSQQHAPSMQSIPEIDAI